MNRDKLTGVVICIALSFVLLSGCGCKHTSMSEATCVEPARCLECGKAEGLPTGHDWLDADCVLPQTCISCGDTKGQALGHSWKDASKETAKTCRRCGATEGEPLKEESGDIDFEQVFDDVCDKISTRLDKAEFTYDEDVCILYVTIKAEKGTAEAIVQDPDIVADYWAETSLLICDVSRDAAGSFRSTGFAVDCWIMLISDVNRDNFLLAACNGELKYDVINN